MVGSVPSGVLWWGLGCCGPHASVPHLWAGTSWPSCPQPLCFPVWPLAAGAFQGMGLQPALAGSAADVHGDDGFRAPCAGLPPAWAAMCQVWGVLVFPWP